MGYAFVGPRKGDLVVRVRLDTATSDDEDGFLPDRKGFLAIVGLTLPALGRSGDLACKWGECGLVPILEGVNCTRYERG